MKKYEVCQVSSTFRWGWAQGFGFIKPDDGGEALEKFQNLP